MSAVDLFILIFVASVIIVSWLNILFICIGSSLRKEKKVKNKFDKKRGGISL